MRRAPLAGFGALVLATIAAFFITQHLKVTTPLIAGQTYAATPHNIVPTNPSCDSVKLYFHLLHHDDSFDLNVVNAHGAVVRALASDVPAHIYQQFQYAWNGRLAGGAIAPKGLYNFSLHLVQQDRTIDPVIPGFPISVQSVCPP